MQKTIFIWLLAVLPLVACAQATKSRLAYFNISQFGFLQGQNQHTYSVQTINGVSWQKYSAGIGVALDNYGLKSIPVFADVRYSLIQKKKSALQLYADAGPNMPLRNNSLPATKNDGSPWYSLHVSFYGEAGLSYSARIVNKFSFIAGIGYNYKTIKYTETNPLQDVGDPGDHINYTYRYSKYVIRLGFGF